MPLIDIKVTLMDVLLNNDSSWCLVYLCIVQEYYLLLLQVKLWERAASLGSEKTMYLLCPILLRPQFPQMSDLSWLKA
jgi:hypothetical protein